MLRDVGHLVMKHNTGESMIYQEILSHTLVMIKSSYLIGLWIMIQNALFKKRPGFGV